MPQNIAEHAGQVSVEFGTLPAGRVRWPAIIAELATRPGEWAKVRTLGSADSASSRASQLRTGKIPGVAAGTVEAAARGRDLWARYIGHAA